MIGKAQLLASIVHEQLTAAPTVAAGVDWLVSCGFEIHLLDDEDIHVGDDIPARQAAYAVMRDWIDRHIDDVASALPRHTKH